MCVKKFATQLSGTFLAGLIAEKQAKPKTRTMGRLVDHITTACNAIVDLTIKNKEATSGDNDASKGS
ncbi:hypothetical protein FACS189496_4630 [Bacilli bacterium]|nr:hypothetical protein FACS189496_4630 [Bacilli bacterium]